MYCVDCFNTEPFDTSIVWCSELACCVVDYRPPSKVQSHTPPRPRKSSSKHLEPMFDGTDTATVVVGQGPVQNVNCSDVQNKQRNSTPVNIGTIEFHCPPVSKLFWVCYLLLVICWNLHDLALICCVALQQHCKHEWDMPTWSLVTVVIWHS